MSRNSSLVARLRPVEALESRCLLSASPALDPGEDPRTVVNLEQDWRFKKSNPTGAQNTSFDDASWGVVDLPHTWNATDAQNGGDNYYRGVGWYRKEIDVPSSFSGRQTFVKFDGASLVTDLYVNGTRVGQHKGAFAAFTFDVTNFLRPGRENLIAVKVNNANNYGVAPIMGGDVTLGGADFNLYGGLYRGVSLIATDKLHVTLTDFGAPGVYLKQTNVSNSSATVQALTKVKNDGTSGRNVTVTADVLDAGGNLVKQFSSTKSVAAGATVEFTPSGTISNPRLWNGTRDPYLYTVEVRVKDAGTGEVEDALAQPLGLRYFRVDPDDGFFLNGQYLDLHGVNYHQDRLNQGWATSDANKEQDVGLMREMGVNFVRMSHYQQAEETYDLLDERGIITWSEIPYVYDERDTTAFFDNIKAQLKEMIRQNYNHPSVMFWGLFNGVEWDAASSKLLPQLNDLAHAEDPSRLTTGATVTRAGRDSPVNFVTDVIGYNNYFGWYRGELDDFGPYADDFHRRYPDQPFGVSEYGAGGSIRQHAENPTDVEATGGQFHPEEYQNLFHEAQWRQMKDRDFLWSKNVFAMFDFAVDRRDEGDTAGRNDKGLVTYDRATRKDAFYFYKSNWTDTPTVYITSRRFVDRPDNTTDVKIYSNLDSVTLKVNGQTIGTSGGDSVNVFEWSDVRLRGGANTIEAVGTRNGQTVTDTVTWNAPGGTGGGTTDGPAVTGFTLYNADTDEAIGALTDGYVINFAEIGTRNLNIRANTSPGTVGSVKFGLDGSASYKVEGKAPYTIGGDQDGGADYLPWTPSTGSHTLKGTAYTGSGATGTAGAALTVSFTVTDGSTGGGTTTGPAVTGFTLFNADTDQPIGALTDGYEIDFAEIGTRNLNIRANTGSGTVGSVKFGLDANASYKVESKAPYTIGGDENNGTDYLPWTPTPGSHTLKGTAYSASGATGTAGTPLTVSFTVTDGGGDTGGSDAALAPTADAHVQGGASAGLNFGGATELLVKESTNPDHDRQALLKFDLGSGSGAITSAKLRLFGRIQDTRASNLTAEVYDVSPNWQESGITWSNRPTGGSLRASRTITDSTARWYEFDVTDYVESERAAGDLTVAFRLKIVQSSSPAVTFNSGEASSNKPQLVITR